MSFIFSVLPEDGVGSDLIGRKLEIAKIGFAIELYQNISIVGETKIGKTSVLKSIENAIPKESRFERVIPVFIDLEKISYALEIEKLLEKILKTIFQQNEEIRTSEVGRDPDKREAFSEVVEYCTRNKIQILLLLDNFDSIAVLAKLDVSFFTYLRGNALERGLSIITASRASLESLCHKGEIAGSQFWNIFNPIVRLSTFDDLQSARELLSKGIVSEGQQDLLISLVGTHPCFLKIAANAVIEAGFGGAAAADVVSDEVYRAVKPYYAKCLKQLKADELAVDNGNHYKLEYVSVLSTICSSEINDQIKRKREFLKLIQKGYIRKTESGHEISGSLFAKYLLLEHVKKPVAYSGERPYLFISYAHKDKEEVTDALQLLTDHKFRFWFDEGLVPGREWRDELIGALKNAHTFLVFISPNSMESDYVLKEINYATNHKKIMLPVYLMETRLPGKIEFELGHLQAVLKFQDTDGFAKNLTTSISLDCKD